MEEHRAKLVRIQTYISTLTDDERAFLGVDADMKIEQEMKNAANGRPNPYYVLVDEHIKSMQEDLVEYRATKAEREEILKCLPDAKPYWTIEQLRSARDEKLFVKRIELIGKMRHVKPKYIPYIYGYLGLQREPTLTQEQMRDSILMELGNCDYQKDNAFRQRLDEVLALFFDQDEEESD